VSRPNDQGRPPRGLEAERAQAAKDAKRQLQRDVIELLQVPAFRRYIAYRIFDSCGLGKKLWRRDAELHAFAARHDVGVEMRDELLFLDAKGFAVLEQERIHRTVQELELAASSNQGDDDVQDS
jgi:hypothetical protein